MSKPTFIVGIGASAGGLESLERLFSRTPEDTGMAFVVIQHLSPDYKSVMDELLSRHTSIPIVVAEEGTRVEANHIYLMPPKKEMIISDGHLHLADKDPKAGLTLPIDHFFRSLAQDAGDRAVAIVLSGTGSDGSRGIKHVNQYGGLVISEDSHSAKFNGMPLASQETGLVHHVLEASAMPELLVRMASQPRNWDSKFKPVDDTPLEGVEAVFDLLNRQYDIDFSHYKPTTVSRRIERRVALVNARDLDEYVERLRDDANELNLLYKDLLIGVTQFFRDAEPFGLVEEKIIPRILDDVPESEEVRVWVAGCATGEEPYSLAILFHEAFAKADRQVKLKIFATDVHSASLEYAARGIFEADRLNHITPERLQKFFTVKEDRYQVSRTVRQSIVFAQHNLLKDAPFTNLDLITCRNLLIYFQPNAQRKALSHFHFGLKTGGTLLLGLSETPGELSDEFETLDEHCKLYRKRRDIKLPLGIQAQRVPELAVRSVPRYFNAMIPIYDHMLEKFMPPAFLVNQNRELVECYAGAEKLLRIRGRRPSHDLLDLLDGDAKTAIVGALARVIHHGEPISFSGVRLRTEDREQIFRLEIEMIQDRVSGDRYYLIVLHPLAEPSTREPMSEMDTGQISRDIVANLEEELRYSKENLQATIEELETSNEEMQATNEELVASNEELQSTNEELHSVNEELYTVNTEHQKKIRELAELNCDMENLLRSTDVAIIFLDHTLKIRRFTPQVVELFDLVPSDIGRRIHTFAHKIRYENLVNDLELVLRDGKSLEREVRTVQDDHYFMRVLPYRVANRIEGIVLSLIDISTIVEARQRLSHLSAIVESSKDAIISMDLNGKILSWNHGAELLYGFSSSEAVGQDERTLTIPKSGLPEMERLLHRVCLGEHVESVDAEFMRKDGSAVFASLTLSPIRVADGSIAAVSSIARDMTERRRLEQMFRRTFDSMPAGMVMCNSEGQIVLVNNRVLELFGYRDDELRGALVETLVPERYQERHVSHRRRYFAESMGRLMGEGRELFGRRKDGSEFPVEVGISRVETDEGFFVLAAIADITARRDATEALRDEIDRRERFLAMLSHELRNPLNAVRNASHLLSSGPDVVMAKEAVAIIGRQTHHMTRLLDDLLDVSRITRDRISLNLEQVDLRNVLDEAVEAVQPLASEGSVIIERDFCLEPVVIEADHSRLEQVVSNLLTNAVKYSNEGGRVTLRLEKNTSHATVFVRDKGVGISSEMLPRIFDLFVQADTTLDRSKGGIGVGLTLARKLVQMHGGSISAHSDGVGQGSEFEVVLPLVKKSSQGALARPHFRALVEKMPGRVLIVEDQYDNRSMLRAILELKGMQVLDAASGKEGLELVEAHRPEVAIIDIGLPEMSGYDVARAIREKYQDGIRLIALTGYGQQTDIKSALDAGFDHHLVKPLQPHKLYQLLNVKSDSRPAAN
ncbi:MAG: PAS domain S-box protein [Planctomycetales bacterium]|nr:PAS domain S-box protein [Planctomycetales bacterium]